MAEAEAGWLVCPLIKAVVDKTKACAADRFGLLNRGVPDALNQLLNELGAALHKVADAVEWSRSARGNGGGDDLDRWLLLLKDAVHEADEVVDEIEYRSLRPDGGMVSSLVKKGKQIVGADEPLNRLRAVIEKLGGIRAISGQLMKLARQEESWAGELIGPHATSVMENGEVIGRDAERKDMVSWLVNSGPPHCPHLYATDIPVAAIMGLGGVGKTTLARNLLQDYSVKAAFDLVMWVCPSAACHKVMLLKQILQSAGVQLPDSMKNFDWLQRRLEKAVSSRRFLLILDNVWNKGGMEIDNCSNITSLPHADNPSRLTTLHIRQCSKLSSLYSLRNLAALESMSIENCSKLTVESFPADFSRPSSLKELNIICCTELESLPSGFPSSLQVLVFLI